MKDKKIKRRIKKTKEKRGKENNKKHLLKDAGRDCTEIRCERRIPRTNQRGKVP